MKQITIYDLLPLLKKGWVAMDKDGTWGWYLKRPDSILDIWETPYEDECFKANCMFYCFKIKRFKGDWRDSLIKVEHKEEE